MAICSSLCSQDLMEHNERSEDEDNDLGLSMASELPGSSCNIKRVSIKFT